MKTLILSACFLCLANLLPAQDLIVFLNGEDIEAKVTEVTPAEIKYVRSDNPTGPLYTVSRNEVFMIKYQNGTKDIITDISKLKTAVTARAGGGATQFRSPGLAFLFSALLPGGGQYYNREHLKGGIMTGAWAVGIITAGVSGARSYRYYSNCYYDSFGNYTCYYDDRYGNNAGVGVGMAMIYGSWLWSVIDAPVRAARNNRNLQATGLLEFEKKDKYALQIHPFSSPGLGGSLTMNF